MTDLSVIILAGGKSSRMGEDKALIPIQRIALLERVYKVAKSCTDTIYIVTPWPERYQSLHLPECKFIPEISTETQGPLVGFVQGLEKVKTEWVLLLACDLPNLQIEVLQNWVKIVDTVESENIAILVKNPKGWEPLCGFYRCNCLPLLQDFINQGGRSFQEWLKPYPVAVLPLSSPEMLFNCNTPEDVQKFLLN
ncbi:molybdenum cofactor guanylyltransferase [Anabaena cylindrica FACHB-243]|uniref:Probable molybdenum cofactor guanylyltransferase n=1 Tax=Anabaena cylindrica (strain ATCC 27899 / PCC 7122) TaxID=272123 RepID=K9ZGP9_ANACC|nr:MULTISPECIES: molybdenum cofactor guanylyltransferase [Anabaena]AFZ58361.1 molybdenum cofactor guanylyltransferase [Anabaena cylindrica PCC 7122]MBD2416956.1 molybdenum cofactor guanylyltransferase [Anabaena cylindrica FACHB-243]MBY5281828.1 molybdenum cofactor guanylyltransferase [Anabaena sp. CCAP 1446/1C]MBY5308820.1 molybdenum cofactor guanylyltransferase [Anabaena sp. CCAP 1446/1C]MCM2406490.1 molybdenum cofactor guanylyltransferase [Anabaena sp. CCAP 1446/1C]